MRIAFNPSTVAALIAPPNNKDITFDLRGQNIFARGVKFCGTDTNTWRDIKINNVSIDSNILDLRNGDNTTLINNNGVVTINSTWRPVVDNLTSDSTTSSLSANQGRILAELINGKSDSGHNHDDRYLKLTGGWMSGDIAFGGDNKIYWGRNTDSASISFKNDGDADSYMSFVTSNNGNEYFRWSHSSGSTNTEWMALRSDGLRVGGTKVSLEGHSHNDLYYTKTEVNNKLNGKSDTDHTHDDRYLKLIGGTMSGTIYRNSGGATISGRDHAIIRQTYAPGGSSWNPIACVDTETGTWTLGHLSSGDSDTNFHFCFSTNTDYNAGNNNGNYVTLRNKVGTIALLSEIPDKNSWNYDDRYVKKSGDTMLGALNFANGTWNLVGDDSYMGDCNISGHFGIKAANTTYPGIAFFNNANALLGSLTAYSGNIKYGAYSLQFLDNGNTSVSASTWMNPFSDYNSNAVADGQAICVWGQASQLNNLATATGDMSLWLKRVNANAATLNMVLDGEYYANGNQRLAHVSEIPTTLKNPYALTISLNGTSQGPYDGSAAKNINITPSSIGAATSDHNHDGRYVYNYGDTANVNGQALNKNALFMSTTSGITEDWWHILQAAWNSEYRWNSQIAFPTQNRNGMYYRSGLYNNTAWGAWVKLLDVNNYSSTLDSRYYTESEVNSLLDAKLNRQNLSYGNWNPRGYNLAADYQYNGGDLSISELEGQIHVSVDGYFWQNDGQYRVLDTSDVAGLKDNLTVHQYLSNTDTTWYPLILGGSSHNNTSDSTGEVYKSHDKLSWQTSSQTLYATNLYTGRLETVNNHYYHFNSDATLRIYGSPGDATERIYFQAGIDNRIDDYDIPSYGGEQRHSIILNPRGGFVGIGDTNPACKLSVEGDTKITGSIKSLTIGGGIYWNPYVESASDGSDAASITLVRQGVAGGTTLVLSQMNEADDTIQFQTNGSARLYHNSYPILTTQNTYVSNNKGYINGTEITQVNNADTIDYYHADSLFRDLGWWAESETHDANDITGNGAVFAYRNHSNVPTQGVLVTFRGGSDGYRWQMAKSYVNRTLYIRQRDGDNGTWSNWLRLLDESDLTWDNIAGKPSTFNPAAHTHTVFKNNLMIKGTNGIADRASIHLGIGDTDTGFKWISDGVCQIYANNVAVGEWTSGGMNWFTNPTVNGNKVWNAGNDGSGSGLDADTLDGYHASKFPYINNNGIWRIYGNAAVAALADNTAGLSSWAFGESRDYGITYLGILKPSTDTCGINAHGTIAVFGQGNTHLGIASDYGRANLQVFGGNADKIVWRKKVAFTDSNVASATKLQTARSIWGQSFDGTGDVSGSLSVVGHIQFSADNTYSIGTTTSEAAHTYTRQVWARHLNASRVYTGDTNLYIGYSNTAQVKFYSGTQQSGNGSNERMTILTNGNIGIGTTSPTYKLHVNGTLGVNSILNAVGAVIQGRIYNSGDDEGIIIKKAQNGWAGLILGSTDSDRSCFYLGPNDASWKYVKDGIVTFILHPYKNGTIALTSDIPTTLPANGGNADSANKLNKWFDSRVTNLNHQFGDGALRIFHATSSTTANKCPSDATILHLAWDNNEGWDSQLAVGPSHNTLYFRGQNNYKWNSWQTVLHNGNSSISGNTIKINNTSLTVANSNHNHDNVYLKLAGGTMQDQSRIGVNGDLYIGDEGNGGWLYFQDIASQDGIEYWTISTDGSAEFKEISTRSDVYVGGQIYRGGIGSSWVRGRDNALLRDTSSNGYHPLWSLKTTNGSWEFGEFNTPNWYDVPVLNYITDTNYNSGNNTPTYQIKFPLASGTVALTSDIPNLTNYYWANVKISAFSSTKTSPTFQDLTINNKLVRFLGTQYVAQPFFAAYGQINLNTLSFRGSTTCTVTKITYAHFKISFDIQDNPDHYFILLTPETNLINASQVCVGPVYNNSRSLDYDLYVDSRYVNIVNIMLINFRDYVK